MVGSSPFISLINYCLILRSKIISGTYGGLTYVKLSQKHGTQHTEPLFSRLFQEDFPELSMINVVLVIQFKIYHMTPPCFHAHTQYTSYCTSTILDPCPEFYFP